MADKGSEITALPELLRVLELAGWIVTVDAMGCQKKIAQEIIESDADCTLALKSNHEIAHAEVKTPLDAVVTERPTQRPAAIPLTKAPVALRTMARARLLLSDQLSNCQP